MSGSGGTGPVHHVFTGPTIPVKPTPLAFHYLAEMYYFAFPLMLGQTGAFESVAVVEGMIV